MDKYLGINAGSDIQTTSVVPLFQHSGSTFYLATEMVPLLNNNPYLTVNAARGLAIREDDAGNLSVAKFNPLFGLYVQIAELVNASAPAQKSYADHKAKLVELSK